MKEIVIMGLGPGGWDTLTMGAWQTLREGGRIFLRTEKHPVVPVLREKGIDFQTFDYLYENQDSFASVYRGIAEALFLAAEEHESTAKIVYAVPGHPMMAEESVQILLREASEHGIRLSFVPAMSFIDSLLPALRFDPAEGFIVLDALSAQTEDLVLTRHTIFMQVYNRMTASDLKLKLLEAYAPEHPAVVVRRAGITGEETLTEVPLAELDHHDCFDYLTSVYLKPAETAAAKTQYPLDPLVEVMENLLAPDGCPWDREQDHQSLKKYLLEEAYEVIEAIDLNDMYKLKEELGDLLLQIVFHTALAQERGDFNHNDVIGEITEKMVRRHPHVFGDVNVNSSADVLRNWEVIKAGEKKKDSHHPRIMDRLNKSQPALLMAEEIQKKASKVGFDWQDIKGPWDKLQEEIDELKEACAEKNSNADHVEGELGDLLFALVNLARFLKVSPEAALLKTAHKFIRRFNYIEDALREKKAKWEEMDLQSLDILWEEAKKAR